MGFQLKDQHAVVTGASAGIGEALAREMAAGGCHLHLVARRKERLQSLADELKSAHGIQVHIYPMDLSQPDAAEDLFKALVHAPISIVVNNAGIGYTGPFETRDQEVVSRMLDLNIRFFTLFCQRMIRRLKKVGKPARILNVGSIAGYQGVHYFQPYAATKAYVNILSEGMNWELQGSNIKVTCLQPGSTSSEFFQSSNMEGSLMATYGVMSAQAVAEAGVKGMLRGKATVIPGLANKFKIFSLRLSPRWLVRESIRFMFRDLASK